MANARTSITRNGSTGRRRHSAASRIAMWAIVIAAALMAWTLMMLGAVWRGGYVALFFPAGWCLYAALRQYRELRSPRE